MPALAVTVALSGSISGDVDVRQGMPYAIWCPTITSGDLLLQGNYDTTSANFVRMQANAFYGAAVSGDLRLAAGPGSCMLILSKDVQFPPYLRIETAVKQAAARSFQLLYRPGVR